MHLTRDALKTHANAIYTTGLKQKYSSRAQLRDKKVQSRNRLCWLQLRDVHSYRVLPDPLQPLPRNRDGASARKSTTRIIGENITPSTKRCSRRSSAYETSCHPTVSRTAR